MGEILFAEAGGLSCGHLDDGGGGMASKSRAGLADGVESTSPGSAQCGRIDP